MIIDPNDLAKIGIAEAMQQHAEIQSRKVAMPNQKLTMIDRLNLFWDWVDNRSIIRRVSFGITLWMSYQAFDWATEFASTTTKDGAEVALIIAAVTGPIAALQAFVTTTYSTSRDKNE
jgi:hypothetical protein